MFKKFRIVLLSLLIIENLLINRIFYLNLQQKIRKNEDGSFFSNIEEGNPFP